ncbi:MAG: ABC transporter ATP-binding protein NatA [Phycisphaerae bacterium]|nr:ABC transporter ATP-binding protein NatA [Phycisphaerae bacterium]
MMIRVERLTKRFPNPDGSEKTAVDAVGFGVARGEIYGLLGPNGAGKTTTLRMISGLMRPSEGRVFIDGQDVTERPDVVKRNIGYLTANTGLYARLSPREMLEYFATLYDIPRVMARARIDTLLTWLNMESFADLRCGAMSTGQKQRTNIARALIADPPILVLDEPTLGLDVLTNRVILEFIRTQSQRGKTILLSTHALDEIESMCGRMGLMHAGRLVAEGDLATLRAASGRTRLSDVFLTLVGENEPVFAH